MPIYDYLCANCGPFEARRAMRESAEHLACRVCGEPAPRAMSAPRLNLMASHNRYAEMRNEKSAHEPDVVHRMAPHGHAHGHGHGHGHTHARRDSHSAAKPQAPKRPWMLGH